MRNVVNWVGFGAVFALCTMLNVLPASAADISADSLKLASDVVKAEAYETPWTTYIVANPSGVFSDHSFYGIR